MDQAGGQFTTACTRQNRMISSQCASARWRSERRASELSRSVRWQLERLHWASLPLAGLVIGRAKIKQLEIDDLVVNRLRVTDSLEIPRD